MRLTQFGMPTLIEIKSIEACAELCSELELSFIELNMNLPEYQADRLDVKLLCDIAKKYDIYYTIHLDENLNPCDFNERIAVSYIETVLHTIEIAKQLSAPILNMHLSEGVYFTMPDRKVFLFDEYRQEYMQKLSVFRDQIEAAVGDADIRLCIENCNGYKRAAFLREALYLLLENHTFALTFDIGHNAGADFMDEPVIMEHAEKLCHMHVHDAIGDNHHLPLGEGELNLAKYLDQQKAYNCRAVLEVKTVEGLRRSSNWLREKGYLWNIT